jgi:hypothetical protein
LANAFPVIVARPLPIMLPGFAQSAWPPQQRFQPNEKKLGK